jgi:hypothetical protein
MMAIHGLDMPTVRPPLSCLTAEQRKDCADTVAAILAE